MYFNLYQIVGIRMSQKLLTINEASQWASNYLDIYERRNNYDDKTNF